MPRKRKRNEDNISTRDGLELLICERLRDADDESIRRAAEALLGVRVIAVEGEEDMYEVRWEERVNPVAM